MPYRRVALMLTLYLSFDLTNPFVGCAFNFNVEESVEIVARQHERVHPPADTVAVPATSAPEVAGLTRPATVGRPPAAALAGWLVALRQAHAPHSDPQVPTEDH